MRTARGQTAWSVITCLALSVLGLPVAAGAQTTPAAPRPLTVRQAPPFASLTGFAENCGQWPAEVQFFARQSDIEATLLRDALVLRPQRDTETGEAPPPLVLHFPAASAVRGDGLLPTEHHFLLGSGFASHVRGFERVVCDDVVPGLDIVVRTIATGFAYDLHVEPGVDLGQLALEVEGAESQEIVGGDVLVMRTPAGTVEQRIGDSWQVEADGITRTPVASRFRMLPASGGRLRFGFEAPGRDPQRAFVLDPSLVYSTYIGGTNQDLLKDMAVAPDGSVYTTARSYLGGPTTPGAYQTAPTGIYDAWVGKLSPDGSTLEWATFLGGNDVDDPFGVDVDLDGTVVVVGDTWSSDFPTTAGSLQPVFAGVATKDDLFVTRLAPDGSDLVWSTFYGGPDYEHASASALFPSGDVLLAALPNSADPPATAGAFDTVHIPHDQLLARISADGTQLVFQTYFKASSVSDIEIDPGSDIYFCGQVFSLYAPPFPATRGAFKVAIGPGSNDEAYIAKLSPNGDDLLWATYFGGDEGGDSVTGLALDAAGAVYVSGLTSANDLPVTAGAFDMVPNTSGNDGFVAKLLPGGSGLVWSTYLSACCGGTTVQSDITVDSSGCVVSAGDSNMPNLPTTPDALQPGFMGSGDAHFTKFDAFGETLVYSTYFGGTSGLPMVGLDVAQRLHMSMVSGAGAPVTSGAYDTTYNGNTDIVVAAFDLPLAPWRVLGGGLTGGADVPNLAGGGALTPGSPTRLSLRGAHSGSSAIVVAGLTEINAPIKGGTLVPAPDILVSLTTSGQGAIDIPFAWPTLPGGLQLTAQIWVKDAGAVHGWSASNGIRMTAQ